MSNRGKNSDTEEGTNTNRRLQTDGSSRETNRKTKSREGNRFSEHLTLEDISSHSEAEFDDNLANQKLPKPKAHLMAQLARNDGI